MVKKNRKSNPAPLVPERTTSLSTSSTTISTGSPLVHRRTATGTNEKTAHGKKQLIGKARPASTAFIQDHDGYIMSLLQHQEKSLEELRRKCHQLAQDIPIKKEQLFVKQRAVWSDYENMDILIQAEDVNRVLKSEIAALVAQVQSYGSDDLGFYADFVSQHQGDQSFMSQHSHSYPAPPPVPPRSKSVEEARFGVLYGRVPRSPSSSSGFPSSPRSSGRSTSSRSECSNPPPLPPKPAYIYKRAISQGQEMGPLLNEKKRVN